MTSNNISFATSDGLRARATFDVEKSSFVVALETLDRSNFIVYSLDRANFASWLEKSASPQPVELPESRGVSGKIGNHAGSLMLQLNSTEKTPLMLSLTPEQTTLFEAFIKFGASVMFK